MAIQVPIKETVRGTQTTEFWTTLFINLLGTFELVTGELDLQNKYVILGMAIVTGLYNASRGIAKQGIPNT